MICRAKGVDQWLGLNRSVVSALPIWHKPERFKFWMGTEDDIVNQHEAFSGDAPFGFLNARFQQFGIDRAFVHIEQGYVALQRIRGSSSA
jgi:hypothetical protein